MGYHMGTDDAYVIPSGNDETANENENTKKRNPAQFRANPTRGGKFRAWGLIMANNTVLIRSPREYGMAIFQRATVAQKLANLNDAIAAFERGNPTAADALRRTLGNVATPTTTPATTPAKT